MSERTPIVVRLSTILAWLAFFASMFWMFAAAYAEDPGQSALAADRNFDASSSRVRSLAPSSSTTKRRRSTRRART